MAQRIDLTGQSFHDLTVIKLSDKTNQYNTKLWECKCSCGNLAYVSSGALRSGQQKSCGCKQRTGRDKKVKEHIASDQIDGTRKSALTSKLHAGNKSGHKGVCWYKPRNKWRAYICFKGDRINLGHYEKLEDAVAARKEAEEKYFKPILDQ
ncbi:hypothetical protein A374_08819 [Fictibacillus macauensis ZFHKF-1]|uniref:Uncharacterized protein n=1 Tax=Fictibacillus macauensis ZFHKF-1 TaxID=1196324 RepID=I8UGA1_9BACL|nr:AP2 domain-containing protein [Fictibacillus macauensis]EIT85925.1 hypothetical protein A374_08819 [Fictibacillus macauensis ZFHKF-1]